TPEEPFISHRATLDGAEYDLLFEYNFRRECWTLTMRTTDGEVLLATQLVRCDVDLLRRCMSPNKPSGLLFASSDSEANPGSPTLEDFGTRVKLYYADADEVASVNEEN